MTFVKKIAGRIPQINRLINSWRKYQKRFFMKNKIFEHLLEEYLRQFIIHFSKKLPDKILKQLSKEFLRKSLEESLSKLPENMFKKLSEYFFRISGGNSEKMPGNS